MKNPPMNSGWLGPVSVTYSIAANLAGWSSAIARAAVSPTNSWIGVAIAATVNGITKPSRW